jgi:hypothetical protein
MVRMEKRFRLLMQWEVNRVRACFLPTFSTNANKSKSIESAPFNTCP